MSYGYVYKTTNLANGRFYIGQHKGVFDPSYLGSGVVIRRAVKHYSRRSFVVQWLAGGESKCDLDWLEMHLISEYRECGLRQKLYNISDGGTGGLSLFLKGKPKSEAAKRRMRERHADFKDSKHPKWNPTAKYHKLNVYYCCDCSNLIGRRATRCIPCRNRNINKQRYAK